MRLFTAKTDRAIPQKKYTFHFTQLFTRLPKRKKKTAMLWCWIYFVPLKPAENEKENGGGVDKMKIREIRVVRR